MKIIFLEAVQNFGGARKSTLELAESLQNDGNDILIVDFWGTCTPFIIDASKRNLSVSILDKRKKPFLLHDSNKIKKIKNYFHYFFLWLLYRKKLKYLLKKFGAELIIINNTKTLSLLSKSKQYQIAFFARGWFLPNSISFLKKNLIKNLANIYIGVSQSTRQAIFAGNFAKLNDIYVVPNAIDGTRIGELLKSGSAITPWHKEKKNRPFTVLHCGGFLETKGQNIAIEVAKELKSRGVDFKILLVGIIYKGAESEQYYKKILTNIEENNISEHVEIILNKTNVIEYFAQSDILIHPSHTEGLPRVVMEAMALGKPVVGNAVGGMTDFILNGFTGHLTDFNDIQGYLDSTVKLMNNKEHYEFISSNTKSLILNSYNSNNQLNCFNNILKSIKITNDFRE